MKCAICGKEMTHPFIKNYLGNNPFPVRTGELDRCCDECNDKYVLFYRIGLLGASAELVEETANILNSMDEETIDTMVKLGKMIID